MSGWKHSHPPRPSSADAQRKVYDAFSEPEEWDMQRMMIEENMLHFHTDGITADDADGLVEATRHWMVDLLRMGHYPSRRMLNMMACELEALYWPSGKQTKRTEEAAWLISVQNAINHLADTKYRDSDTPRTLAEEAVAKLFKLSVDGLRKKQVRYRAQLRKREAEVERRREAAVQWRRERRR